MCTKLYTTAEKTGNHAEIDPHSTVVFCQENNPTYQPNLI